MMLKVAFFSALHMPVKHHGVVMHSA